ncbi:glycine zipper 2TM domain-containing protein [Vibrio cortegadensis]|uniref:Glycine zipper 2TM domain-containing protein n=1 Tax=Vibrio cortegadensis TaxID=1328770 RepID=A0ABV4M7P9_9VIBR
MKRWLLILLVLPMFANAGYQRNQARPVNSVVYGKVDSVRYITEQQIVQSQANGWETLLGGVAGGLIGNQFGGGSGKEVATAVGAIAGAGVARNRATSQYKIEYKLVEILIKTDSGKLVDVIQDVDSTMLLNRGDSVRILYFDDGVRVDLVY